MDTITKIDETDVMKIMQPTISAFLPLLLANKEKIQSVRRETFQYGSTDRHKLDVYYPPRVGSSVKPSPILVFVYGGGMTSGERTLAAPLDLVYANCGAFFANRGILTVIPDYRLAPGAMYPQPAEDVRDAVAYVLKDKSIGEEGDVRDVYVMGHSAGGMLVASIFLDERIEVAEDVKRAVKGIVLRGAGYHLRGPPSPPQDLLNTINAFYKGESDKLDTFGLLQSASAETVKNLPELLVIAGEKEPEWQVNSENDFVGLLEERWAKEVNEGKNPNKVVERYMMRGHNHMSGHWALGSDDKEGEEWGEEVVRWIQTHSKRL